MCLILKGQTLRAQWIEVHKFRYGRIQKGDPRRESDKLLEETLFAFFYTYKDKLLNDIEYDILVRGINSIYAIKYLLLVINL